MRKLAVKHDRIKPILGRHPWVFSGGLKDFPKDLPCGSPVQLMDEGNNFLASGYFNPYSQIAVRIWSYDKNEEINDKFFRNKIKTADELRKKFVENKGTDSYRLINSENDLLPGLIVDKYADYLVLQFHTRGIEFWKEYIVNALIKKLKPKGIYERSDIKVREIEGAKEQKNLLFGKVPEKVKIKENGYDFWVDMINGQKTGFFLDQRDKRAALQKYVKGKTVLNCFSYTGGFSVYALAAGAKKVVSVDISETALRLAKENVKLNKLDAKKCEFINEDVKKYLRENKDNFDVIILDPPAFIKDRRKIKEGIAGYRKINELALNILESDGILVSCSCSAHLPMQNFRFMLTEAAAHANKTLQIVETYTHGIDHPQLTAFIEGEYLKCVIGRVI